MPSMAGYSYGNSFDVRIKLNTDPNLTLNPIRTRDRAPNPNRPTSQKKTVRPVGVVKHGSLTEFCVHLYCAECTNIARYKRNLYKATIILR